MIAMLAMLLFVAASAQMGPPSAPADAAAVEKGPDTVVLNQVAGCYGSVRFDHRLHVGMSSIGGGCTNCHHNAPESEPIKPCRTCHEVTSSAVTTDKPGLRGAYHRQCLSCHKDWAHENACGFCHTASSAVAASPSRARDVMAMLQPRATARTTYLYQTANQAMPVVTFHHADHAEVFGLKCADCHGGSSCGQCHGSRASRPVVSRQQSCYKCHAESRCVTCHNLGEQGRFDHAKCTGWRLRAGHTDLSCASCHGEGSMPARPTSDACRSCHSKETGGVFDHSNTGVELYGNHAKFECVECHAGGDDRAIARCTGCHIDRPVVGQREVGLNSPINVNRSQHPTLPASPQDIDCSNQNPLPGARPAAFGDATTGSLPTRPLPSSHPQ